MKSRAGRALFLSPNSLAEVLCLHRLDSNFDLNYKLNHARSADYCLCENRMSTEISALIVNRNWRHVLFQYLWPLTKRKQKLSSIVPNIGLSLISVVGSVCGHRFIEATSCNRLARLGLRFRSNSLEKCVTRQNIGFFLGFRFALATLIEIVV